MLCDSEEVLAECQLTKLFFHITRKHCPSDLYLLRNEAELFLRNGSLVGTGYIDLFLAMILHTRNTFSTGNCSGKGEHDISYMLLALVYDFYPIIAKNMVFLFFTKYGSWRDMKYLCDYLYRLDCTMYEPFIAFIVQITNQYLKKDYDTWKFSVHCHSRNHISSLYKWIPREHKQFDWLHERLARNWAEQHKHYIFNTIP